MFWLNIMFIAIKNIYDIKKYVKRHQHIILNFIANLYISTHTHTQWVCQVIGFCSWEYPAIRSWYCGITGLSPSQWCLKCISFGNSNQDILGDEFLVNHSWVTLVLTCWNTYRYLFYRRFDHHVNNVDVGSGWSWGLTRKKQGNMT